MKEISRLRIFVSSPGDVGREREVCSRVLDRLQAEFAGSIRLEPYFWEHEPMRAHKDFQSQIESPSDFDLFVCILWSRLGTRLHPGVHHRADGSPYASGTEYEFEDAMRGLRESNAPEMLVYRRNAKPVPPLEPEEKVREFFDQYTALKTFWEHWTRDSAVGALKAAFNPYEDLADFETRLGKHLHRVIEEHLPAGRSLSATAATWTDGSPFRGLAAYEFEHYPVFRGRTRAIDEVLGALREQSLAGKAFVLVFGGSGVGKSSLARAGVMPMLVQPGVIEGVGLWRRVLLAPSERGSLENGGDLFDSLAAALIREHGLPELVANSTRPDEIAAMLRDAPQSVGPLLKSALTLASREEMHRENLVEPPVARLALLIDQMEELFTLATISEEERATFLRALDALARSGAVWVLATLRSDFFSRCEAYQVLMELKEGTGAYHLKPPSQAEIGQMIRLPAAAAGLQFEENHRTGERLDDLLRDEAMANPGALPLMAFALEELYERRDPERGLLTLAAYDEMGRLQGALGRRAEEVYASLSDPGKAALDSVLRRIVHTGGGDNGAFVRRPAPQEELTRDPGRAEVVDTFAAARLFQIDRAADGSGAVTLAHEALLAHWPRMREWLTANGEFLVTRDRVVAAAERWEKEDRRDDLLLQPGKSLAEASELMEKRRDDLPDGVIAHITASTKHERSRQRRRVLLVAGLVAAATSCFFVVRHSLGELAQARIEQVKIDFERDFNQAELSYLKIGTVVNPEERVKSAENVIARYEALRPVAKEFGDKPGESVLIWRARLRRILDRLMTLQFTRDDEAAARALREERDAVTATLPADTAEEADRLGDTTTALIGRAHAAQSARYTSIVQELQVELAFANEHLKALFKQDELLREALAEKLGSTPPESGASAAPTEVTTMAESLGELLKRTTRGRIESLEFAVEISNDAALRGELANVHLDLADSLRDESERGESDTHVATGIGLLRKLVEEARTNGSSLTDALLRLRDGLERQAKILEKRGDESGTRAAYEQSLAVLDEVPDDSRVGPYEERRYNTVVRLAEHLVSAGENDRARTLVESIARPSLVRDRTLFDSSARDVLWRHGSLARTFRRVGDTGSAATSAREGIAFAKKHGLEDDAMNWSDLSGLHALLGGLAHASGRLDDFRASTREAHHYAHRLFRKRRVVG